MIRSFAKNIDKLHHFIDSLFDFNEQNIKIYTETEDIFKLSNEDFF